MKSKVLFLLHWPPPVHGSSVVGLQIKESKIINANFDCYFINLGTSKSIEEIGKNPFNKVLRYVSILWKVLRYLITNHPDLCYLAITAKGVPFYKDTLVVLLVKLFRVKLIYHFHNKGVSTRHDKLIDNFLYRFVFKNSDVILLSKHLYSDIQTYIPKNKIHICPNGIAKFDQFTFIKDKRKNDIIKILFLSNLFESKGVFVLLEACSILRKEGFAFECNFIGSEGDISITQFQDKVKSLGLTNHVKYLGRKYGEEKNQAFNDTEIFVFPTYYETFGLVILEAMQHELPVISTIEGGIPDVVEDGVTGFLVPKFNSMAVAEKLKLLIENPKLCQKLGKAGRKKFESLFTLEKFEERMVRILNQMVNK